MHSGGMYAPGDVDTYSGGGCDFCIAEYVWTREYKLLRCPGDGDIGAKMRAIACVHAIFNVRMAMRDRSRMAASYQIPQR
jgi:hypothetical protein